MQGSEKPPGKKNTPRNWARKKNGWKRGEDARIRNAARGKNAAKCLPGKKMGFINYRKHKLMKEDKRGGGGAFERVSSSGHARIEGWIKETRNLSKKPNKMEEKEKGKNAEREKKGSSNARRGNKNSHCLAFARLAVGRSEYGEKCGGDHGKGGGGKGGRGKKRGRVFPLGQGDTTVWESRSGTGYSYGRGGG